MASNAKDLREYLRNVLDIESSLYVLQKFSEELYCKLNGLGALKARKSLLCLKHRSWKMSKEDV